MGLFEKILVSSILLLGSCHMSTVQKKVSSLCSKIDTLEKCLKKEYLSINCIDYQNSYIHDLEIATGMESRAEKSTDGYFYKKKQDAIEDIKIWRQKLECSPPSQE